MSKKKCVKKGENGWNWVKIQTYHILDAKEASKCPFSNNNRSPTRGQTMGKEGENWGEIGKNFARRAQHTTVLSMTQFLQLKHQIDSINVDPATEAPD